MRVSLLRFNIEGNLPVNPTPTTGNYTSFAWLDRKVDPREPHEIAILYNDEVEKRTVTDELVKLINSNQGNTVRILFHVTKEDLIVSSIVDNNALKDNPFISYADEQEILTNTHKWKQAIAHHCNPILSIDDVVLLAEEEAPMPDLPELDLTDAFTNRIKLIWDWGVGDRTILYYSCLLGHSGKLTLAKLRDVSSLAGGAFDDSFSKLLGLQILDDDGSLNKQKNADQIVGRLIFDYMGGVPFEPPFSGLKIQEARSVNTRYDLWVQASLDKFKELFGDTVDGLEIQPRPINPTSPKDGTIAYFNMGIDYPQLMIMFMNTKRMEGDRDIQTGMAVYWRAVRYTQETKQTSLPVIAAPTYDDQVSRHFTFDSPTPLLGPINMAILSHGLEQRQNNRDDDYHALLNFLANCGSNINAVEFLSTRPE